VLGFIAQDLKGLLPQVCPPTCNFLASACFPVNFNLISTPVSRRFRTCGCGLTGIGPQAATTRMSGDMMVGMANVWRKRFSEHPHMSSSGAH
jgi:hypothetical protein